MRLIGLIAGLALLALLFGLVAYGEQLNRPLGQTGTFFGVAATPSPAATATPTALAQVTPTAQVGPTASPGPLATATASPTASPTLTPSPIPTPTATPAPLVIFSSDGNAQLVIPNGALAPGVSATLTALNEQDLPPELVGVLVRASFYRIEPIDAVLSMPVTVIRNVDPTALGMPLDEQRVPLIQMTRRDADGNWTFLGDMTQTLNLNGLAQLSGTMPGFGLVFGFGNVQTFVRLDSARELTAAVGAQFEIRGSVNYAEALAAASRPRIVSSEVSFVGEEGILMLADSTFGNPRDTLQRVTATGSCLSAGTAIVSLTFTVENLGAGQTLFQTLGLATTTSTVTLVTELTCGGSA